jgi:hypothetical protein
MYRYLQKYLIKNLENRVLDPYSFDPIRIQRLRLDTNPDPDPIRIQGFNDLKLGKNYS